MSLPGIKPGPPAWEEASTLEKSHPDSLLIAIRNIYSTYEPATPPTTKSVPVLVIPFSFCNLFLSSYSAAKFIVSDWGYKVDSCIGLSYRPGMLHRLHCVPVRQPCASELTLTPSQGLWIWLYSWFQVTSMELPSASGLLVMGMNLR